MQLAINICPLIIARHMLGVQNRAWEGLDTSPRLMNIILHPHDFLQLTYNGLHTLHSSQRQIDAIRLKLKHHANLYRKVDDLGKVMGWSSNLHRDWACLTHSQTYWIFDLCTPSKMLWTSNHRQSLTAISRQDSLQDNESEVICAAFALERALC